MLVSSQDHEIFWCGVPRVSSGDRNLLMRTSTAKERRSLLAVIGGLTIGATATAGSLAMHAAKVAALADVLTHWGNDC